MCIPGFRAMESLVRDNGRLPLNSSLFDEDDEGDELIDFVTGVAPAQKNMVENIFLQLSIKIFHVSLPFLSKNA